MTYARGGPARTAGIDECDASRGVRLTAGAAGRIGASGSRARAALGGGFRGVLGRDATPEVLAAAIEGLRHGIVTIDQRFAADVLPAPTTSVAPLTLTPRENQVLELLAEGLSNKEIGAQLGVSPHTAKFHVTALLDKFGAETRTEAVVLAARAGLLAL